MSEKPDAVRENLQCLQNFPQALQIFLKALRIFARQTADFPTKCKQDYWRFHKRPEQFFGILTAHQIFFLSLTLKGIPSATITIDKEKNMVYLHPKVNIEGEIYTLEIKASLQE